MSVATPYVIRNGLVKIATVDYSALFTKTRLVPQVSIQTFVPIVPSGVVQDVGPAVWQWEVTFSDDWTASTGLAAILAGDDVSATVLAVVMAPKAGSTLPQASFNIVAVPVGFGGDVGTFSTQDATFPVVGQPVWSAQS